MSIPGTIKIPKLASKPSAPEPGKAIFYIKTDNAIYVQDSDGNEYAFASADLITALHGDVVATGPGDAEATVVSVGGATAADIASAAAAILASTSNATPNTLAKRDGSGVFKTSAPTDPAHVTNKNYVDNLVLSIPVAHGIQNIAGVIQAIFGSTADTVTQGNDSRLSATNVVKVKQNPGAGEFSTLEAAMASITTASASNPFAILINPGIYTVNNSGGPLVLKPYVSVAAEALYTAIFQPSDPTKDLFQVTSEETELRNIVIQNVTGSVAAGIRITRSVTPFIVDHVKFVNCTEGLVAEATSFPIDIAARSVRFVSGPATIRFVRAVSSIGQKSAIRLYSMLCTEDDGTSFVDGFLISGTGSRMDANTVLLRSSTGVGNGFHVKDGGEFVSQSGSEMEGFNKNLWFENSGAAPIGRTTTVMLRNGVTSDLQIDHPGTTGSIEAKANTVSKVFVDTSAPIKLILTDPASSNATGIFIKGDILQADRFDRKANLSLLARTATSLGLIEDGTEHLTVISGLQINVAAGQGFLDDPVDSYIKQVVWPSTNVTLPANSNLYVYIDTNSSVQINSVTPDNENNILLGRVVTTATGINFIEHSDIVMDHIGNRTQNLLRRGLGPIFGQGAVVSENATPFKLDVTSGGYYYGTDTLLISGGSAVTWESLYQNGSGGWVLGSQSTVDSASYDDGSGTLASLSSGFFTKHTLYVVGDNGAEKYFLVYGQAQYSAMVDAQNAPLPLVPNFITDAVARISGIVVKQGQSNINTFIDLRPRLGFAAPSSTVASNHHNLTHLADGDDHPMYLPVDGSRPMTGPLHNTDTTQSTNKDTGSIITEGGLGVEKNINAGGTILGSNLSGSNSGDITKTDSDSIAETLTGQNIKADLKLSADAADAGNVKATTTVHSGANAGLHVEVPFGTPVQVGTSNNTGSSTSLSLADHVHAVTIGIIGSLAITGYAIGSNAVLLTTDTILQAFGKLQGQISAIVAAAMTSLTGDVTGTGPGATATTISVGAVTDTKASLSNKPAVTVVATTNQTLTGSATIDGQATTAGTSIVLATAQTTASQNGPWIVQTGAWTRPTWFPTGGTTQAFQFITMLVRLGTVYQGSTWRMTTSGAVIIDTTSTAWAVTPQSGNFKADYVLGIQTGASAVTLAFANAFKAIISWNPTANFTLTMPPAAPTAGQFLAAQDNSGTLQWTNPVVNIDGGTANSLYTSTQIINGGTP